MSVHFSFSPAVEKLRYGPGCRYGANGVDLPNVTREQLQARTYLNPRNFGGGNQLLFYRQACGTRATLFYIINACLNRRETHRTRVLALVRPTDHR